MVFRRWLLPAAAIEREEEGRVGYRGLPCVSAPSVHPVEQLQSVWRDNHELQTWRGAAAVQSCCVFCGVAI